jgi:DNA repair protein RadC
MDFYLLILPKDILVSLKLTSSVLRLFSEIRQLQREIFRCRIVVTRDKIIQFNDIFIRNKFRSLMEPYEGKIFHKTLRAESLYFRESNG